MAKPVCMTCGRELERGSEQEVLPPTGKRGQAPDVEYSQEIADRICGLIASGISLRTICEMEGMPSITAVINWRARDNFLAQYTLARADAADAFADEIMAIADDRSDDWVQDAESGQWKPDHDHINRAKLRVDARKWIAAKLKPQSYGDRVEARLTGELTTRNINVNIDTSHLTVEQREAIRAAILPRLAAPPEDEG